MWVLVIIAIALILLVIEYWTYIYPVLLGIVCVYLAIQFLIWAVRAYKARDVGAEGRIGTLLLGLTLPAAITGTIVALAIFPIGSPPNTLALSLVYFYSVGCALLYQLLVHILPVNSDDTWARYLSTVCILAICSVGYFYMRPFLESTQNMTFPYFIFTYVWDIVLIPVAILLWSHVSNKY